MGRGINTTKSWPVVKQIGDGPWLVDTGSRIEPRQRRRFSNEVDADKFAAEIRKGHLIDGKATLTTHQRDEFRLAVSTLGQVYSEVSLVDVAKYYMKQQALTAHSPTINQCIPKFIAEKEGKAERYQKQLQFVLKEFGDLFGERKPNEVTKEEMRAFINGPRMNKRKPGQEIARTTRHNLYRAVCAFYAYCLAEKWIMQNPMETVNAPTAAKFSPKILTIDEAQKLLDHVAEKHIDMLGFVALGLFCGIRVQELCRMRISDLQLESHDSKPYALLEESITKTKHPRNVRIPHNCYVWLNLWLDKATVWVSRNSPTRRPLKDSDKIIPVGDI